MLRRINDALPGLVAGIILYGIIIQITGVWFVEDRVSYSIGLWYGITIAIGMAINLAKVIFDSVTIYGEENANRRIIMKSVMRYAVVGILFFILGYFKFGSLYTALIGILGLKVSAYVQPLFQKIAGKLSGRSDAAPAGEGK